MISIVVKEGNPREKFIWIFTKNDELGKRQVSFDSSVKCVHTDSTAIQPTQRELYLEEPRQHT